MIDSLYIRAEELWDWLDDNLEGLDQDFQWLLDNWHMEDCDVHPGQWLLGLYPLEGRLTGLVMTWGVAPPWAPDQQPLLTIESEAITDDDSWHEWCAQGRCILLASAYYPPDHGELEAGTHHRVRLASGEAMPLAGLWATGPDQTFACAILKPTAGEGRQPLIIPPEHVGRWLDPEIADPAPLRDLLRPLPAGALVLERAELIGDSSRPAPTSGPQPA